MILNIIVFILVLGILVFVHEFGHFIVAKLSGMRVDEFAIGFPPRLFGRQKGDTLYAINAIPIGGYVKIHGESPEEGAEPDPRSFQSKPLFSRALVMVAGVCMNLIFAYLVLVVAFSVGFTSVSQDLTTVPGNKVLSTQVRVGEVEANSPASKAGLQVDDQLTGVTIEASGAHEDLTSITQTQEVTKKAQGTADREIELFYTRAGQAESKKLTLASSGPAMGIALYDIQVVRVPFWQATKVAWHEAGYIISATWDGLKSFGHRLFFTAKLDPNTSGPIGIYQATASAAHQGIEAVVFLVVALSINLALFNILPIPALDGGKLLFLLIEAVFRRRVVSERLEAAVTAAGFTIIIGLIIILTIRDLIRL